MTVKNKYKKNILLDPELRGIFIAKYIRKH